MKQLRPSFWQRDWFWAALLLAATTIAYAPAWNGQPIWDDDAHLTSPELQPLHGLADIWTRLGSTQQYYPLVHTIFWIEHRMWGDAPLGYHLVNIVLHVLSALLLARILTELKIPGAWFAAGIFALHPIQVESVAWISELKNTLSGVLFLSSALVYLTFDRTRNGRSYFVALALFFFGLLSKSVIAVFPATILVILWWKRGRLSWRSDVRPLVPFFVIGVAAGVFTAWVERTFVGAEGEAFNFSIVERTLIAGRAFWFYLSKLFWPVDLAFIYPRWHIDTRVWWQYLFPLAAFLLIGLMWALRRRWRAPLAGILLFVGMLFPVLGFLNVFPFIFSFVADHFQYLACIGIIALTSAGLTLLLDQGTFVGQRMRFVLGGVLLLSLGAFTWRQTYMYRDAEVLWRVTLARNLDCWMAHNNLATVLQKKGRLDEAISHYEQTIAQRPNPEKAYYNLGVAFAEEGKIDKAIAHYEKAVEINPNYPEAHYNLARNLVQNDQIDAAIAHYQKVLALRPGDVDAHNNLGSALAQKGRLREAITQYEAALRGRGHDAEIEYNLANALAHSGDIDGAIAHYKKALEIQPAQVQVQYELASALLQQGRPDEAIARYREVLKIKPDHVKSLLNLANLLLQKGDAQEAIAHYEKSLEVAPDDAPTHTNLAWVLATSSDARLRNGERALDLARRASTLSNGHNPFALRSLAAAYAETGQYADAMQTVEEATRLAADLHNAALTRALEKEMEFYKAGRPFRKPEK